MVSYLISVVERQLIKFIRTILVSWLRKLEIELGYYKLDRRKSDQDCFIADICKAKRELLTGLLKVSYQQGISENDKMV